MSAEHGEIRVLDIHVPDAEPPHLRQLGNRFQPIRTKRTARQSDFFQLRVLLQSDESAAVVEFAAFLQTRTEVVVQTEHAHFGQWSQQ